MSDIELVVKIPEKAYELLKNKGVDWLGAEHILNAVANGIPLPKGHGSIGDLDKALILLNQEIDEHDKMMAKYETYRNTQIPGWMWKGVCEESTIVEADTEQTNGNNN